MADKIRITVRMFVEAALTFSGWKCPDCNKKLEQVWIGDENEPDLHYVHCPACEQEFDLIVAFVKDDSIPKGR